MQTLVIRRGMSKQAADIDGPTFEQQFGILTNAIIADKFPQLDRMKLAFQLIEKSEDNLEACGAAVYMLGKNVIFIPSFFKNNKPITGDMMFLAQTQQFLPLSDPWLAWLKNKDAESTDGDLIDASLMDEYLTSKGQTIRELADPIIKTASMHFKALLHKPVDLTKMDPVVNVFDTAIHMGKQASETMLDTMLKSTDMLNSALAFYSGATLNAFAKKASALCAETKIATLIQPFDEAAKNLNQKELQALYRDGYFIQKQAVVEEPDVIPAADIKKMFAVVNQPGKFDLLRTDGSIKQYAVYHKVPLFRDMDRSYNNQLEANSIYKDLTYDSIASDKRIANPGMSADTYMAGIRCGCEHGTYIAVTGDSVLELPINTMYQVQAGADHTLDKKLGDTVTSKASVSLKNCYMLFPDGTASSTDCLWGYTSMGQDAGWTDGLHQIIIGTNEGQVSPIVKKMSIILPKNTRIVAWRGDRRPEEGPAKNISGNFVTVSTLDAFIVEFTRKNYNKTSIYSNGSEIVISGDKTKEDSKPLSSKEAALHLCTDYNINPDIAKLMLKQANTGATDNNPKSTRYFITKTALDEQMWESSNIPMDQKPNKPAQIENKDMPTVNENPEQLRQAMITAANNGIKEVFDVTALKLLVKQNRFFDEIADDIPLFMRVLDSLCRKLFQFYWHTDKMGEKYGVIKLKALEQSLKVTLDSLSELTIFFKLRTVDGSGVTGDNTGDLMSGQML